MRIPFNRRLFVVLLSAFLGWTGGAEGRMTSFRGPELTPSAPAQARQTRPAQAPQVQPQPETPAPGNPVVLLSTSLGDITLELYRDKAPVSVENFLQYANEGFYNDTVFHRVRKGFMIQGGGFTATLVEKPTRAPILNEATDKLNNVRGTIAMARRQALRSATSQFYINVVDNHMLDHTGFSPADFGYAVFGRVLSGMEVADRIAAVPTISKGDMDDVPIEPVTIKAVRVVR
jgi:cyclophilin family peptidyl-prolyl cis-trans isomerase